MSGTSKDRALISSTLVGIFLHTLTHTHTHCCCCVFGFDHIVFYVAMCLYVLREFPL